MTAPDPDEAAPAPGARLFIALWPPAGLAGALHARYEAGRGQAATRPVPPQRIHLTLHFLGDVALDRIPALRTALRVPCPSFELSIGRIESWGRGLVVAVPERIAPALLSLHDALADALTSAGLRPEARTYRPHVTLARRHRGDWPAVDAGAPCEPLRWSVHGYVLVRSVVGKGGGYQVLQAYAGGRGG